MSTRQDGFTLLELMVAIGILVFGLTSLLGVLTVGVSTRRSAEQRSRAVLLAEQAIQHIETEVLAKAVLPEEYDEDTDLEIAPVTVTDIDGYPNMKYTVEFEIDPELPELVLARVRVSWREQGENVGQVFHRVLFREAPYSQRVAQRRGRQ